MLQQAVDTGSPLGYSGGSEAVEAVEQSQTMIYYPSETGHVGCPITHRPDRSD